MHRQYNKLLNDYICKNYIDIIKMKYRKFILSKPYVFLFFQFIELVTIINCNVVPVQKNNGKKYCNAWFT